MPAVTIEEAKGFLRIEGEEEDAIVSMLIDASEAQALRYTGDFLEEGEDFNVYPDFKLAILKLVGAHYNNREAVLVGKTAIEIPFDVREILRGLRTRKAV